MLLVFPSEEELLVLVNFVIPNKFEKKLFTIRIRWDNLNTSTDDQLTIGNVRKLETYCKYFLNTVFLCLWAHFLSTFSSNWLSSKLGLEECRLALIVWKCCWLLPKYNNKDLLLLCSIYNGIEVAKRKNLTSKRQRSPIWISTSFGQFIAISIYHEVFKYFTWMWCFPLAF